MFDNAVIVRSSCKGEKCDALREETVAAYVTRTIVEVFLET